MGKFKVLKDFFQTQNETVVGGKLISGKIKVDIYGKVTRNGEVIGKVKLTSIKDQQNEIKETDEKGEYGIKLKKLAINDKIKIDDIIEFYVISHISKKVQKIS